MGAVFYTTTTDTVTNDKWSMSWMSPMHQKHFAIFGFIVTIAIAACIAFNVVKAICRRGGCCEESRDVESGSRRRCASGPLLLGWRSCVLTQKLSTQRPLRPNARVATEQPRTRHVEMAYRNNPETTSNPRDPPPAYESFTRRP